MNLTPFIIVVVIVFRLLLAESKNATQSAVKALLKLRFRKGADLLGNNFIDSRKLFIKLNRQLPNIMLINGINVNEAVKFLEASLRRNIKTIYRHNQFSFEEQCALFNMIIIVTKDNKVIEIGNGYVELQYAVNSSAWANALAKDLAQFQLEITTKVLSQNVCIRGFAGQLN